jgi:cytochrome c oxidase subunit IV
MGKSHSHNQEHSHHIIPYGIYLKTAAALFVLTVLTVAFHEMHLGALAAPVAFLIASVKAGLVMLFFMGLKYDNNTNRVIFSLGFFFLLVLFLFSALDIWTRIAQAQF